MTNDHTITNDRTSDVDDEIGSMVPRSVTLALTLAWLVWILVLGLGPRQRVVGLSNDAAEPVQHVVGFLVLGALVALQVRRPALQTITALIGLGLLGELAQLAADDRSFGWIDLSMDAIGATAGIGAVAAGRGHRFVVIGVHVVSASVLAASPWMLAGATPETSFPERCFPAPPDVDRAATRILDVPGLPSDDFPVTVERSIARDVRRAVVRTNELTVETWFETTNLEQQVPATMFTIGASAAKHRANLHLGIHRDDLVVRLRTACEFVNEIVVDDVVVADRLHHLVVTWSAGELAVWLDGDAVRTETLPWGDFEQWNASFPIAVGDEAGGGRRFDGTVHALVMWDAAMPADEIVSRSEAPPG